MVKLIFKTTDNSPIMFVWVKDNMIRMVDIKNEWTAKNMLRIEDPKMLKTEELKRWFSDNVGGKRDLNYYIDRIKEKGFYTPYFNSLRIDVVEESQ